MRLILVNNTYVRFVRSGPKPIYKFFVFDWVCEFDFIKWIYKSQFTCLIFYELKLTKKIWLYS